MNLFGMELSEKQLIESIGQISQVAGMKRHILCGGRAEGVEAVDVKTGSGFQFTVLPGRAMDIAWAEYNGIPLGWISKSGIVAPQYYEPEGLSWLRSFFGGVLTTCGLTQAGAPCEDQGEMLGQHGRIGNIPAEYVNMDAYWQNGQYIMKLRGSMVEACTFNGNLKLTREIKAVLGDSKLYIHDQVENIGYQPSPLMLLYHMNFGFPIVSQYSRLCADDISVAARDEAAKPGIGIYDSFQMPTKGYAEQVFFHSLRADADGYTSVGIINKEINTGIYIRFNINQLPYFTEWKMMGQQDYVVGLEPGNCIPEGRAVARNNGRLQFIQPGEIKDVDIELAVLSGEQSIQEFINDMGGNK